VADLEGITLHKILSEPKENLEHWSKLKSGFFSSDYLKIYSTISNFYDERGVLPSFKDLSVFIRNKNSLNHIIALEQLKVDDDIDLGLVVDALIDNYTQDETLKEIDTFVDEITFMSSQEIKESLANISLVIEDKTQSTDEVYRANEMFLFDEEELHNRVPISINNSFDAHTGGAAVPELIMIGGYRGSGKSVVSSNICVNQYNMGNTVPYFSIEMPAQQVFRRNMAILANIGASRIKKHKSVDAELKKAALVHAEMYEDAEDIYEKYCQQVYRTYKEFELELRKTKNVKPDNQIIIIKDRNLTTTQIDVHLTKLKDRHGDKIKVCVVDYLNQLAVEDMYDWKVQIELSKSLKNMAEKHEVVMITPYQIDLKGEARFSKGILDAADIAMTLEKGEDYIKFKTTKIRDDADMEFASLMNWETLRISPEDKVFDEEGDESQAPPGNEKSEKAELPF
jgi:replicative DNA helicase